MDDQRDRRVPERINADDLALRAAGDIEPARTPSLIRVDHVDASDCPVSRHARDNRATIADVGIKLYRLMPVEKDHTRQNDQHEHGDDRNDAIKTCPTGT